MEVAVKVSKWGNSLAIRLPAEMVEKLGLKEGDELIEESGSSEGNLVLKRKKTLAEMWARVAAIRSKVKRPEGYKFDRDEANSRGR